MISISQAFLVGAVCVCIEGFFSGSEIAMVSASRTLIRQRAAEGDRAALLIEKLLQKPQTLLATTLIGTNLALITFSVTMTLALLGNRGSTSEALAVVMVTPMTLLLGEVIPKSLCQHHADRIIGRIVYPLHIASLVLRPAVWIMGTLASAIARLLGTDQKRAFITREELSLLIEAEAAPGSEITHSEREMIANVLEMSEAEAQDVMVPLSEVAALPERTTLAEAALEIGDKQHSRMPVFRDRIDNVVGIVHVFDLLAAEDDRRTVAEVARPAKFVPETVPAIDLLVDLQRTGDHMAVVVDEYGGAVGVVTVEDLLEEVVGEIDDEYDDEPSPIEQERPGVWRIQARTAIDRINSELGVELPESEDYETIGGLLLEHFHRIPKTGESMVTGPLTVRVLEASDRAIEVVQLLRRRR